MKWVSIAAGALAGFGVGFGSSIGLSALGFAIPPGIIPLAMGVFGAVVGGGLVWLLLSPSPDAWAVARWSAGLAVGVGGVAFLAGFVGPMILRPDSPQGPLLGIFITGPLGTVAGALAGFVIGLLVRRPRANRVP
jgi:hypothetical protein